MQSLSITPVFLYYIYNIAVDAIMEVKLTLYNPNELHSVTFRGSLYYAISSTALSQLSADRPIKLLLASVPTRRPNLDFR